MWQKPEELESTSGLVGHFFYGIAVDQHNHSSGNSSSWIFGGQCHGNCLFCSPFSPVQISPVQICLCKCHQWQQHLKNMAFLTFYIAVLLSLAISFMELQWTDTTIEVRNRAHRSFVAYVMGIACSVGLSVLLRSPPSTNSLAQMPQVAATSPRTLHCLTSPSITPSI